MAKPNLTIDREFQQLLPTLTDEEQRHLEESIQQDGCRDSIVYWENGPDTPIIDGMNRFAICQRVKQAFTTTGMAFPDRSAVRCWILRNQLGKRNLTDAARSIARGRLYNEQKGEQGGDRKSKGQNVPLIDHAKEIAAIDGVDPKTVKRNGQLAKAVDAIQAKSPEIADAVSAGTIPVSAAATLADAPKSELRKLAKLDGKELRDAVKEAVKPQDDDVPPWEEEEEDDDPVVEFIQACNTGKIKATKDQRGEMAALEEDLQRALTDDIVAGNQSLSNALRTKRVATRDSLGNIVDESVAAAFHNDFKAAMQAITEVKKRVHALMETEAGGWIDGEDFDRLLTNAHSILKFAAPYCECAKCRRTVKKSCPACKGTGWVHNSMYKSAFSDADKEWLASKKKQ